MALFLFNNIFLACLFFVTTGSSSVWTSPALPKLKVENGTENPLQRPITLYEEAMVGSLHSFGTCLGCLVGTFTDVIGRKWTAIAISTTELAAFLILAFANHIYVIYITRLVQGLCMSAGVIALTIFVGEISQDHNRGKFCAIMSVFINIGNIYGFLIGSVFHLETFTILCAAPVMISLPLFLFFIPESPVYLLLKKKRIEARLAFEKFHNMASNEAEIDVRNAEIMIVTTTQANRNIFAIFWNREVKRVMLIGIGLTVFQEFSGIFAILGYFNDIFPDGTLPLSPYRMSILISVMQLVAVLTSAFLIEIAGRKVLLLISSATVVFSLLCLGFYFMLVNHNFYYLQCISWIPVASVILFIGGYATGLGPVVFVLMGEIYPTDFKSALSSLSILASGLSSFGVTYTYPIIRDFLGKFWSFLILSGLSAVGFVFFLICVPETRGKSFLEIQLLLNNTTRNSNEKSGTIIT